jgi:hypothetical protein
VAGLSEAQGNPAKVAALEAGLKQDAGSASMVDATAAAVEKMRAADVPAEDAVAQSFVTRVQALEAAEPNLPVRLNEDGSVVTLKDEMDRVRREAAEGTDDELGSLDADLLRVAAECDIG